MQGKDQVKFTELFADTVNTHGVQFAWKHYAKHGMTRFEFRCWMRSIRGVH